MGTYSPLAVLVLSLLLCFIPVFGADEKRTEPRDDGGGRFEELGRDFRNWLNRWWENFGGTTAQEQQPVISLLLRNREKIGLSEEQVKKLEQLRSDFEKETIRNEADIRIAEIDLNNLLQAPNPDMGKIETKIRDVERLRADLRIARIRAMEKGKALLSVDQRKKLQELTSDQRFTRFHSSGVR